ncbi:MAG: ComEC/Rec2 family competence protein [Bacillota bacterium]|nr:ComEC/Rec2 family competence protein [Bacillota bacterium]
MKKFGRKAAVLLLLSAAFGVLSFVFYERFVYSPIAALDGYTGEIKAEVTSFPDSFVTYSKVEAKLLYPKTSSIKKNPKIALRLKDGSCSLRPGDIVTCTAGVTLPKNRGFDFDYEAYRRGRGIYLSAAETDSYSVRKAGRLSVRYYPAAIKKKLGDVIDTAAGPNGGLIKALLTGEQSGITDKLKIALSKTGTSHIAVVSGMHTAFLTGLIMLIFGNGIGIFVSIPVILLFMAVTGFSPSVMRAGIMSLIMLSAPLLKRETDRLTSLGFALFIILLLNPYAVKDSGLLLSFGATIGIILFCEPMSGALKSLRINRLFKPGISIITATLSATAFTLPLTAVFFGRFSIISPLSNLLVLPLISAAFSLILLSAVLGCAFMPSAVIVMKLPSLILSLTIKILNLLSKAPFASVSSGNVFFIIFAVFIYFSVFVFIKYPEKKQLAVLFSVFCVLLFTSAFLFSLKNGESSQVTSVLSPYAGGRCVVVSKGNNAVMIDCGGGTEGQSASYATDYLAKNGINKIDTLILTSFDRFHAGASEELIKTGSVDRVLLFCTDGSDAFKEFISRAQELNLPVYVFGGKAYQKDGDIAYMLTKTKDGSALVKVLSPGADILVATLFNSYALAHAGVSGDILIMDRPATVEKAAVKLVLTKIKPEALILSDDYQRSETGFGDFKGLVFTTGENGTVSVIDRSME